MSAKIEHILSCAMDILQSAGAQDLSMRKVADKAGMRLSNLQYYFKTKELLLSALLGSFLQEYSQSMQAIQFNQQDEPQQRLYQILFTILTEIEKGDCAVIFKELWAIAERNEEVKNALNHYYQELYQVLYQLLKTAVDGNVPEQVLAQATAILLPFIEGYCITRNNLPVTTSALAKQLTAMVWQHLNSKAK